MIERLSHIMEDAPQRLRAAWGLLRGTATDILCALAILGILGTCLPVSAQDRPNRIDDLVRKGEKTGMRVDLMQDVIHRGQAAGMRPPQVAELLVPAVSLGQKNYPSTPVLMTTLEGLSKRVPPSRLTPVLEDVTSRIEASGELVSAWLGERTDPNVSQSARFRLIEGVAHTHQRGVSFAEIGRIWDALHPSRGREPPLPFVATAMETAAGLSGGRSFPEPVRRLLGAAVKADYTEADLRELGTSLKQSRSGGALSATLRSATQLIGRGAAVEQVRQRMSVGGPDGGLLGPDQLLSEVGRGLGLPARPPSRRPADAGRPDDPGNVPDGQP